MRNRLAIFIFLILHLFTTPRSSFANDQDNPLNATDPDSLYMVEGIMYSPDEPFVIINGEVYKTGDVIDGATIKEIKKDVVCMEFSGNMREYASGEAFTLEGFALGADADIDELQEAAREEKKKRMAELIEKRAKQRELLSDSVQYLEYEGEKVRIDIYNPGGRSCPVVVLIHGAAGIKGDRAVRYKKFATDLKRKGIIAINIHYFDCKKDRVKAISKAIDFAANLPNADMARVGLVGYSAGGTLGLLAASSDNRVKALGIGAGYMPSGFSKKDASRLPPIYFGTGSKDPAMKTLRTLEAWFKEFGRPFESKIYEGYGHSMPQELFDDEWSGIKSFIVRRLKWAGPIQERGQQSNHVPNRYCYGLMLI